ncbi:hypothetical protein HanRHA438_Chr15g0730101 [Helianthus annuus]|nr:hypothetical protein HanRHA438_Chr15g0730101 [Helianthus annuus]
MRHPLCRSANTAATVICRAGRFGFGGWLPHAGREKVNVGHECWGKPPPMFFGQKRDNERGNDIAQYDWMGEKFVLSHLTYTLYTRKKSYLIWMSVDGGKYRW